MRPVQGPRGASSDRVRVEVRCVDLGVPAYVDRALTLLSVEEIETLERAVEPHRTRRVLARAALRVALSHRLGVPPADLTFVSGSSGKPRMATQGAAPVEFNLSKSGEVCLVALTESVPVGIDVEQVRPLPDAGDIARRFFGPAEAAALGGGGDVRRFLRYWTAKEAYAKGVGAGLSLPLGEIAVPAELEEQERVTFVAADGERWALVRVDPGPETVATLAVRAPADDVTVVADRLDLDSVL